MSEQTATADLPVEKAKPRYSKPIKRGHWPQPNQINPNLVLAPIPPPATGLLNPEKLPELHNKSRISRLRLVQELETQLAVLERKRAKSIYALYDRAPLLKTMVDTASRLFNWDTDGKLEPVTDLSKLKIVDAEVIEQEQKQIEQAQDSIDLGAGI